ncbi:MAG: hypothetical protein LLG04_18880 [Parachlamydia sp.]|jgi:hypothetical protein|nr:hypothetical protein [Parachlamydia sp.]
MDESEFHFELSKKTLKMVVEELAKKSDEISVAAYRETVICLAMGLLYSVYGACKYRKGLKKTYLDMINDFEERVRK